MCYRLTYLLHLYLLQRGIDTTPVIGYVNDGTDDIFMSHAWLEHQGKKVDLALGQTQRPDLNVPGDVLVLDYPIRRARSYSYHLTKSPEAVPLRTDF